MPRDLREHHRERHPARARGRRAPRCPSGTSGASASRDLPQQLGIALEQVLVEVLVAHRAGAQGERARQVRHVVDPTGQLGSSRHGASRRSGPAPRAACATSEIRPFACSQLTPMRSWSTSPAASGAIPSRSVAARASVAGSISSPYAGKHSSPSQSDASGAAVLAERRAVGSAPACSRRRPPRPTGRSASSPPALDTRRRGAGAIRASARRRRPSPSRAT